MKKEFTIIGLLNIAVCLLVTFVYFLGNNHVDIGEIGIFLFLIAIADLLVGIVGLIVSIFNKPALKYALSLLLCAGILLAVGFTLCSVDPLNL
jgi:hypothetical protein